MLEEVQINAPVIFPSAVRRLTANEKRRLETAEAFSMDWRRRKNSPYNVCSNIWRIESEFSLWVIIYYDDYIHQQVLDRVGLLGLRRLQ